jgi:hypothetical protein
MTIASRFDFGDVVLVPFPFTDQSGTKRRPAIVVSLAGYNMSRRDIVIMARLWSLTGEMLYSSKSRCSSRSSAQSSKGS